MLQRSHGRIVELALQFLGFLNFTSSLHEVLMDCVVALRTNGEHSSLSAHIAHISAFKVLADFRDSLKIDVTLLRNVLAVDPDNVEAGSLIWERDLNFAIETTGSEEGRVEHIRSIRCHDALNSA